MSRRATVSLDLDNQWSYLKTHGDSEWRLFPSFLDVAIPHILECCEDLNLVISFFVVGQDAALDKNGRVLSDLGSTRHEIGNHSFHHEPWLHLKSPEEIHAELSAAHRAIADATGREPKGFRGPGYSISVGTLESLIELGYQYDCSTLPTFIGPLARFFYLRRGRFDAEDLELRARLFGTFTEVLQPIKPYRWISESGQSLVEVPVTTMPFLRLPIHLSYLMFLCQYSPRIARGYLRLALLLCRQAGVQPSVLLHSHDFLGGDDVPELRFFPSMRVPGARKRYLVRTFLRQLLADHDVVPIGDHVATISEESLPSRQLQTLT